MKSSIYLDETGGSISIGYVNSGYYPFEIPVYGTELRAEYVRVATRLSLGPSQMTLHAVQTWTGDGKMLLVLTEVKDEKGVLIVRYIDGV